MRIILPDRKIIESERETAVIKDILKSLEINPASVIVAKNGEIVPDDITIENADELKIISFAHGG